MPLSFLQENCEGVFPHVENLLLPSFCRKKKPTTKKPPFQSLKTSRLKGPLIILVNKKLMDMNLKRPLKALMKYAVDDIFLLLPEKPAK